MSDKELANLFEGEIKRIAECVEDQVDRARAEDILSLVNAQIALAEYIRQNLM